MFAATFLAFNEEQIARTRLAYADFSRDLLPALASFRSKLNRCLRSQLQNCSMGFKSGDRAGTFHSTIFCFR